jgi:DNA-nicking Smr family endonuclease
MSGRKRSGGRNGYGLTADEEALWEVVTERVHPLRRAIATRVTDTPEAAPLPDAPRVPEPETPASPRSAPRWQKLTGNATPRPTKPLPPAVPAFDRKQVKKIATGRIEIEGRIDLHGLRESEAHLRLSGFLRQAQAQGKRTVLVITGKGQDRGDEPYAPFDFGQDRARRGVLKRNVPRWLSEPDMAGLVVSYTTAHTRHGGDGALYVHLRKVR